jgi:Bacterial SH3 domain
MKKLASLSLFLLITFFESFSQGSESYIWKYEDNYESIVAAKNCYLRSEPSVNSTILDSLQLGKKVMVLKSTEQILKLKGIETKWVEISFKNTKNETKTGFIWIGFLALDFKTDKNLIYLTSLDRIESKKQEDFTVKDHVVVLKILNENNEVLVSTEFKKALGESYFFQDKLIGGLGLKNISQIYRVSFSGQACAIPTYYFYYAYDGSNLLPLPEKYQVSDAGIYYYGEDFLFPDEPGGKPNQIIKVIEEGEETEKIGKTGNPISKIKSWKEYYSWDGFKATFLKKDKIKYSSKTY